MKSNLIIILLVNFVYMISMFSCNHDKNSPKENRENFNTFSQKESLKTGNVINIDSAKASLIELVESSDTGFFSVLKKIHFKNFKNVKPYIYKYGPFLINTKNKKFILSYIAKCDTGVYDNTGVIHYKGRFITDNKGTLIARVEKKCIRDTNIYSYLYK
jgi:hypothetical protein